MQSIRNKLMAAICMLLVSSIMMVSTTYAWFTLSTAPEVSGITTAVGANGNLEMALLPEDGEVNSITSESGDHTLPLKDRNVTWGNLVDLSDDSYGLDQITLYPAELNATTETTLNVSGSMLKTPTYGPDGRVDKLEANTVTGTYSVSDGGFPQNELNRGVRAVGTASGMTDRQLAYRNARSTASTFTELAKTKATQALTNHGSKLASIAVKHAANSSATHTLQEVKDLQTMINELSATDGILDQIDKAYIQYIIGYAASAESGLTDIQFNAFKNMAESKSTAQDLVTAISTFASDYGVTFTLDNGLTGPISKLVTTKGNVATAKGIVDTLVNNQSESYQWDEIDDAVAALADASKMKLNDYEISQLKTDTGNIANSIIEKGINLQVATGAGVFADIADHCGDYSASIVIEKIEYGGMTVTNAKARMETKSANAPSSYYLPLAGKAVTEAGTPGGGEGNKPITDMYGYVVDLAFRTNAADSKLLLQTDAVDRIYEDGGTDDTMGHGSTMIFKATTADFDNDQVISLMRAVKIIFFDPTAGTILAKGSLDADNASVETEGLTADIRLSKVVTTYEEDENGTYKLVDGTHVPIVAGETYDGKKFKQVNTETLITNQADAVIMPLTQNDPAKVSVLVYLDGNQVKNEHVATAATSVTSQMNLQFSSSAILVPMEYTPLSSQAPATPMTDVTATVEGTTDEVTASASFRDKSVTVNLTAPTGKQITGVKDVTVGGTKLESGTFTYSNGVLKFAYEGIEAETSVAITVTVEEAQSSEPVTP